MQVTIQTSDEIYNNFSRIAREKKRRVDEIIAEKLEIESPFAEISYLDVLAMADLQMPEKQSERHSELFCKQQVGTLKAKEKTELEFFQEIYGIALVRKAEVMREAFSRGLIKSLKD